MGVLARAVVLPTGPTRGVRCRRPQRHLCQLFAVPHPPLLPLRLAPSSLTAAPAMPPPPTCLPCPHHPPPSRPPPATPPLTGAALALTIFCAPKLTFSPPASHEGATDFHIPSIHVISKTQWQIHSGQGSLTTRASQREPNRQPHWVPRQARW